MKGYTYYLSAYSCRGYTTFFDENIKDFKKIVVLNGAPKEIKREAFDKIKNILNEKSSVYDNILKPGTLNETDAFFLKDNSLAVCDNEAFCESVPLYSDVFEFHCPGHMEHLIYETQKKNAYERMYFHLSEAKKIHDEWEKIYISNMDCEKINKETDLLIENIFETGFEKRGLGKLSNRFFGTMLARENINFINDLTKETQKRIFIKGRPGSGKSTILKKIAKKASENGYDTEVYYCSFDSKSLDMVIIPDIGVSIFDSTSPHEMFPENERDSVFDVYKLAFNEDTDEIYKDEIMHILSRYNSEIKKAKECLYSANILTDRYYSGIKYSESEAKEYIDRILSVAF